LQHSLSKLKSPQAYRLERDHLFPSDQSLIWFIRNNRPALIEAKALLKLRGRTLLHDENFDAYVMAAAQAGVCKQLDAPLEQLHGPPVALAQSAQAALCAMTKPAQPVSATPRSPKDHFNGASNKAAFGTHEEA